MYAGIEKIIINYSLNEIDHNFLQKFGFELANNSYRTRCNSSICFDQTLAQPYKIVWGLPSKNHLIEIKNNINHILINENNESCSAIMPDGNIVEFNISKKCEVLLDNESLLNQWGFINRKNKPIKNYQKASIIDISHIVIETTFFTQLIDFYLRAGFVISDTLINRGIFLRFGGENIHHNIFIIKSDKNKINHIGFSVGNLFELISGGIFMQDNGYNLSKGPGFHPISSSLFWYFDSPFNCQFEYVTNEDYLTDKWVPRNIEFSPEIATKWILKRI